MVSNKPNLLPNIVDVAEEYGVVINPRTYGKKQVLCKCPFCLEDAHKGDKWYLSLNPDLNVFKCWYCGSNGTKGGVLHFESLLSGKTHNEVKEKYFDGRKNVHPAEYLDPKQLEKIGWRDRKRKSYEDFKKNKDIIYKQWKEHERMLLIKWFGFFLLVSLRKEDDDLQEEMLSFLLHQMKLEGIIHRFPLLLEEYIKDNCDRCEWALEGAKLARGTFNVIREQGSFEKMEAHYMFMYFFYELDNKQVDNATKNMYRIEESLILKADSYFNDVNGIGVHPSFPYYVKKKEMVKA